MSINTIYELAQSYDDKQEIIVDPFQREAPLFQSMPCMLSSKADKNIFDIIKDVAVPTVTEFDAPLPKLYASTESNFASLAKVGGRFEIGRDRARLNGGVENILERQLPPILSRAGASFDYSFLYNSLRKFCIDNYAEYKTATSFSGQGYSMIGINWADGENIGLVSPYLPGEKVFETTAIGGGNIIDLIDKTGHVYSGYALEIVTFIGIQLARPDKVHALVNIDASHMPTAEDILNFIDNFKGYNGNNCAIYAHPKLINALRAKYDSANDKVGFFHSDGRDIYIDNVRIIRDDNLLAGTEASVTLA